MDFQHPAPSWALRLSALEGLKLTKIARAADMAMLHFGVLRPQRAGRGMVGEYALHIQCSWRLERSALTLTGQTDLRVFSGRREMPSNWDCESGSSVQDRVLDGIFGERDEAAGWLNTTERFVVISVQASAHGDLQIDFSPEHTLRVFPDSAAQEKWRFFVPGAGLHLVYRSSAELE